MRILALVALIATLWAVGWATGLHEQLTVDSVRAAIAESGALGVALFVALFCVGQITQLPGNAFVAAAVFAWGWWQGAAISLIAATAGAIVSFTFARAVGGDLKAVQKPLLQRVLAPLHHAPLRTITLARLVFMTAPPLSPALALSGVRHRDHAVATFVGMTPPIFLMSYVWAYGLAQFGLG